MVCRCEPVLQFLGGGRWSYGGAGWYPGGGRTLSNEDDVWTSGSISAIYLKGKKSENGREIDDVTAK